MRWPKSKPQDGALYRLQPEERRVLEEQSARIASLQADLIAQVDFIARREKLGRVVFNPQELAFYPEPTPVPQDAPTPTVDK